jgi:zinc protease
MLIKVGSLHDPNKLAGLNYFTANLLERGTKHRDMMKLTNDLGQIGSEISIDGDNDYTLISTDGLSIHSKELLEMYADVIQNPAFENQEVERVRTQILASIQKKLDHPDSVAADGLSKLLYGTHPYGFPTEGLAESIRKMSKKDFIKHYLKFYRPNNSLLAVVGPQIEELKKEVQTQFTNWPQRILQSNTSLKVNQELQAPKLSLITKESLQQTQVRFGMLGIQRNEKDFLPLRVANMILGGTFASRLNMRVRDELGLTYSISSYFEPRKERGPFVISTFTRDAKLKETVLETVKSFKSFYEDGVTNKELDAAKAILIGQFPQAIETSDKLARNLMILRFYEIPDSYLRTYLTEIQKITKSQVNEAIKTHLNPQDLHVLIYADESKVKDQMTEISKQLGDFKVEKIK